MGKLRPPQEVFKRRPEPSRVPGIRCNLPLPIFALFNPVPRMHRTNEVYPSRPLDFLESQSAWIHVQAGWLVDEENAIHRQTRSRKVANVAWLDELLVVNPQCP